jgi:ABC-type transport system involved in multi-copper enzyme maturation permease subunit
VTALPVTRGSLREAISRRLVVIGLVLSAGYLALFAFGFNALYTRVAGEADRLAVGLAAGVMTILGLYVVRFLAALLAIFLSSSAVASEIDSGVLHAVLARPLSRTSWLAQRWLAFVLISVGYVLLMTGAITAIARGVAGYAPLSVGRALLVLALELAVLLSLGLLTSTTWSAVTSGVITFSLFGVAWLAGIIELIGTQLSNEAMRTAGIVTSLVVPSDALWRGASYYLQSPSIIALASQDIGTGNPFTGSAPPTTALVVWSVGYVVVLLAIAAWRMRHRDL